MKPPDAAPLEVSTAELEAFLEQARPALSPEAYDKLSAAVRTLAYVTELLEKQEATLAKLRQLLCPSSTEKTKAVLEQAGLEPGDKNHKGSTPHSPKKAARGHGRHAAAAYGGATKVPVPHASLKPGDACPDAQCSGKVYAQRDPGVLVRIKGRRRWPPPSMNWKSCGAICAGTSTRPKLRPRQARRSTTNRPPA